MPTAVLVAPATPFMTAWRSSIGPAKATVVAKATSAAAVARRFLIGCSLLTQGQDSSAFSIASQGGIFQLFQSHACKFALTIPFQGVHHPLPAASKFRGRPAFLPLRCIQPSRMMPSPEQQQDEFLLLTTDGFADYRLVDFGEGRKL